MDQWMLKNMYQQWIQGQSNAAQRWLDFVEMAARVNCTTADQVMKELQKCSWFLKGD
jgi:hypothetical protein